MITGYTAIFMHSIQSPVSRKILIIQHLALSAYYEDPVLLNESFANDTTLPYTLLCNFV